MKEDRSTEDAQALEHDRKIYPPRLVDTKGRPQWAGSQAQKQLRQDIKDGKHKTKKPKELFELNPLYYEHFDLDFIRNKIYQEVKALKRVAWMKDKEERKEKKKGRKKKK